MPARSKRPPPAANYPRVEVATRAELRAWLRAHHADGGGAWIVTRKRDAGGTLGWNDIVEEALCFGWIDSLPRKLDDQRSMLLVTPRKPGSAWSAKNKRHVEDLERRGLMQAAGRAVVADARARGTWSALDEVSALVVPPDLEAALAARSPARRHWDAFPPSVRRGILEWISQAKRASTRARRVDETARLARDNVRANQWPRDKPARR
ncbi:MAG: YdeI/OmpD-associated family protein [Kofleriaceae bacterium]|nr:YdeI/OmpD-associated family protein [Kofleriaceae bacterium]